MEVVTALHIGKGFSRNGGFLYKAACNSNVAIRHRKGVLAVLFGKGDFFAVFVQNG